MRSSRLIKSSRPVSPYSRGELNSLLAKGAISPGMMLWMLGSSSKSALRNDEPRELQPNWKIAALVVTIFFGGISVAGTLPIENKSDAAITANDMQEAQDHTPLRITARVMSDLKRSKNLAASRSTPVSAGFDPASRSDRTVPVAQPVLSMQRRPTPALPRPIGYSRPISLAVQAGPATPPTLPAQRQPALEFHRSMAYSRPMSLSVPAAPVARPTLPAQRQPALEFHRSMAYSRPMSLSVPAPVARPTLPAQRQPALEFRRSIAHSQLMDSYRHYLDRYSSGTFVDLATASIDEPKTTVREEANRIEIATDAKIK